MNESEITIIEGEGRHKLVDWRELHRYRDLLFFSSGVMSRRVTRSRCWALAGR